MGVSMKSAICPLAVAASLMACSVTRQHVPNSPPTVQARLNKVQIEFGAVEQLTQLSMFFWPITKNGVALSVAEKTDIVAKTSMLGADLDRLTDAQNQARKSACEARVQMIESQCLRFDPTAGPHPIDLKDIDDPCS